MYSMQPLLRGLRREPCNQQISLNSRSNGEYNHQSLTVGGQFFTSNATGFSIAGTDMWLMMAGSTDLTEDPALFAHLGH